VGRTVPLVDEGREDDGGEELDDDIVYNETTRVGGNDNQGGAENLVAIGGWVWLQSLSN